MGGGQGEKGKSSTPGEGRSSTLLEEAIQYYLFSRRIVADLDDLQDSDSSSPQPQSITSRLAKSPSSVSVGNIHKSREPESICFWAFHISVLLPSQ